jgi:hypothetical protein
MVLGSLVAIRAAAPDVYDQALRLPPSWPGWAGIAFLLALAAFIALLAVGVLRRWRWAFWLILVAFLAGVLRVPVAILQLRCPARERSKLVRPVDPAASRAGPSGPEAHGWEGGRPDGSPDPPSAVCLPDDHEGIAAQPVEAGRQG